MSNDWALCRAIANANERVREEGGFIVGKIRKNNYLRTTDILQAMNSEHLTEVQAAIDRSDQIRIVAEKMYAFVATKFQREYLKTIGNEYSQFLLYKCECVRTIMLSTFYLSARLSKTWIVTKRNMTQQCF